MSATSLKVFISHESFLAKSSRSLVYWLICKQITWILPSLFLSPLLYCLALLARIQGPYWRKVKKCRPLSYSKFPGNALRFSIFSINSPIGLGYMSFIMKYVPSISSFLKAFIIKECWTLSKTFPTCTVTSVLGSAHILESLIDLYVSNHPYITGVKSTWAKRIIFLCIVEFHLDITHWEFLHQYLSGQLTYNLF